MLFIYNITQYTRETTEIRSKLIKNVLIIIIIIVGVIINKKC